MKGLIELTVGVNVGVFGQRWSTHKHTHTYNYGPHKDRHTSLHTDTHAAEVGLAQPKKGGIIKHFS